MENQTHSNGKPNSFLHQKVFSVTKKVQSYYLLVGLKRNMEITVRTVSVLRFNSMTSRIV